MFKYGSFRALDTVMEQFEQHIRQIEGVYPNRKPVLIGHSLGGVLIRAWLLNPDNHKRIAGVITLGTPHGGSRLAMLGFGAMVKHITPQADLIKALKNAERIDALPCVSLLSSTDEMVLPSENLLPPNEWQARLIHNVNHYGLLTNSMIGQAILRELNEMETRNG
jgi:triacylglycerol lipase